MNAVEAALQYAARGWRVFPLNGKVPQAGTHGFKDATVDHDVIRAWPDNTNVGIATGGGLVVIDIDGRHGGGDTLAELEVLHGRLPDTVSVETGGGGEHYYFRTRAEVRNSTGELGPGIDVRGEGGYVVAPPSRHPSGRRYEWDNDPAEVEVAQLPGWLERLLTQNNNGKAPPIGEVIPHGKQHDTLVSLAGSMRRRGAEAPEIAAALKEMNRRRCEKPGTDAEMDKIAESMMRYAPEQASTNGAADPHPPKTTEHTERSVANPHQERDRTVRSVPNGGPNEGRTDAPELAQKGDILAEHDKLMATLGLVGERHISRAVYLVHVSRLLEEPARAVIKGDSSSGKSFAAECALTAAAEEELYVRTSTSPLAMFYSDRDFRHTTVVFYEANKLGDDDDDLARVLRTLISEGRLAHEVTVVEKRTSELVEKEGPVAFISTTCMASLDKEIETRILSMHSDSTDEQTTRVVREYLNAAAGVPVDPDVSEWEALDRWLAGGKPYRVVLPWAPALASFELTGPPRLRRDIKNLVSLARAHAVLHQASRDRDNAGRILSTIEDYDVVRRLLSDAMAVATDKAVRPGTRAIVEAVEALRASGETRVSMSAASRKAKRSKSTTNTDVHDGLERGYLLNLSQTEKTFNLDIGDPLPEQGDLLPETADLEQAFANRSPDRSVGTERRKPASEEGWQDTVRSVRSFSGGEGS